MVYKKASDSTKIGRFSPATPYIRSVQLFKNQTVFTSPRRPYDNDITCEMSTLIAERLTTSKDRVTDDYMHRSVEGILLFVPRN